MIRRILTGAVFGFITVALSCQVFAQADVIEKRQQAMKGNSADVKAIKAAVESKDYATGTVWVSCHVRRDLDWALLNSGATHSVELHCGSFPVAQLLLRPGHGKRRSLPSTAADLHSRIGGSCTLQPWKDFRPGWLAV